MNKAKYYEVIFDTDYSICIRGIRQPTADEAAEFLKKDMETFDAKKVSKVQEISYDEAHDAFDMEDEDNKPVFGAAEKAHKQKAVERE